MCIYIYIYENVYIYLYICNMYALFHMYIYLYIHVAYTFNEFVCVVCLRVFASLFLSLYTNVCIYIYDMYTYHEKESGANSEKGRTNYKHNNSHTRLMGSVC